MSGQALARVAPPFADEVHAGLVADGQKTLPCRYFYDAVGTALFEAITMLPEYGLSPADDRIIHARAAELARKLDYPGVAVELGSGSGAKTRRLLDALARRGRPVYYPIDVSAVALEACRKALTPVAEVRPFEGDYLEGLREIASERDARAPLLVLFLGSTIGNFDRAAAERFLSEVRASLLPGDALLLGTDLEKSEEQMRLAYDDPAGVTAAFNLNLLARINRELGGDFVLRNFAHEVRYDRDERRIEMHLRSRIRQRVRVREAAVDIELRPGETIWTESAHKFRLPEVRELARRSGFRCAEQWIDAEWPFAENLLVA